MNKETTAAANNANGKRLVKLDSPWFLWPAAGVFTVLLYFGLHYLNFALTHETTDDAFIAANVVSIAPRVAGQVSAVHVLDNQMVHSNQLLVEIDPSDYATTATQKQATVDEAEANYKVVLAGLNLMIEKVTTAEATADQSKADAQAAKATDALARSDFQRVEELRKENTVSAQEFDAAKAALKKADADLIAAQQKAVADASKISEAKAQLTATKAAVGMALAQLQQAQANARTAQLDLSYTKIVSPCEGRVTSKSAEPGDYVQVGQTLMSIVPTNVYVVANFKESQLRKMQPGQPVLIEIDALGGQIFRAHVNSIQAGSGAAFSLLPPENATGNYVKVVQRVPVKILFDQPLPANHTFGPGLSVEPSVRVSKFSLPAWVIGLVALILASAAGVFFQSMLRRRTNPKAVQ
ncbi:MAG TPA: HlyD family secretion protein [Candidatus Saccharimonadales bacterium]|nr:HlyD family secretion protein [Candidatus Saccharimonadales bacterium]